MKVGVYLKTNSLFSAAILIGFGLYFFLGQTNITFLHNLYAWPTILCIVGIAFLMQAYKANKNESILPGIIFLGFGIHFHVIENYQLWPNEMSVFILIIALGLLLQGSKTKSGSFHGWVLLLLALLLLFKDSVLKWIGVVGTDIGTGSIEIWPFLLVISGIILLFLKK